MTYHDWASQLNLLSPPISLLHPHITALFASMEAFKFSFKMSFSSKRCRSSEQLAQGWNLKISFANWSTAASSASFLALLLPLNLIICPPLIAPYLGAWVAVGLNNGAEYGGVSLGVLFLSTPRLAGGLRPPFQSNLFLPSYFRNKSFLFLLVPFFFPFFFNVLRTRSPSSPKISLLCFHWHPVLFNQHLLTVLGRTRGFQIRAFKQRKVRLLLDSKSSS